MENRAMTENEKKKEYLRRYRKHARKVGRIASEIEEIRLMKTNPSISYDGMPHGNHGQGDLSGYAADLDENENMLYEEGVEQVKTYKDISWRIKQISDEDERDVLFYRYIKGMEFWEIAKTMEYSERQIHRFHAKALAHFKIRKNVSPCQSNL